MTVERTYHCDAPDCDEHVRTAAGLPIGVLRLTGHGYPTRHFCSIDCVLRWAATQAPDKTEEASWT